MDFDKEYAKVYAEFETAYDLTTLNSANDRANLEQLVRNIVLARKLDAKSKKLIESDDIGEVVTEIKKLSDMAGSLIDKNMQLERQLGIDRKSRKKDSDTSPAEYISHLKRAAREYLEQRLIRVSCPHCNVLVFRFAPAHEHTAFKVAVQCSQCDKLVIAERKERDIFYDLKPQDRAWRKQYPVKITHAKNAANTVLESTQDIEPDIVLGDDTDGN